MKLIVAFLRQALIVIFLFGSSVSADETVYVFILINGYVTCLDFIIIFFHLCAL
jgi:hypothetical protein